MPINWKDIKMFDPPHKIQVLIKSDSGYNTPKDITYRSAIYDPEFRPYNPWVDESGGALSDYGLIPTHWSYIEEYT